MSYRRWLFRIAAFLSIGVSIYHSAGIFYPVDSSPPWRHAVFVVVSLFCCYGLVKRPGYFIYFFFVLLAQQFYSHGSYLIRQWYDLHKIHWISVVLLLILPVIFYSLVVDKRNKKQGRSSSQFISFDKDR